MDKMMNPYETLFELKHKSKRAKIRTKRKDQCPKVIASK
jgi:hypothetical protein